MARFTKEELHEIGMLLHELKQNVKDVIEPIERMEEMYEILAHKNDGRAPKVFEEAEISFGYRWKFVCNTIEKIKNELKNQDGNE